MWEQLQAGCGSRDGDGGTSPLAHAALYLRLPAGLLDFTEEGGCECSISGCSAASGCFANRSKASPPEAGGKR